MKVNQDNEAISQKVRIASAAAFGCTLLALILQPDVSGVVSDNFRYIPFCVSTSVCLIPIFLNFRLPRNLRVRPYKFGWRSYWHPYCTLMVSVGFTLYALPLQGKILRTVNIIGLLIIVAVVLWAATYHHIHQK